MKKRLCILSFSFFALMLCTGAYAAVEPVITANGMSGTVNIAADSAVTIRVQLSPGDKAGTDADWWLAGYAFGRWYYYQLGSGLTDIGTSLDIAKLRPVYQGKLFTLPSSAILQIPQVPAGTYSLYFGTDTNMNGKLDTDSLVFDSLKVTVNSSDGVYGGSGYSVPSTGETGSDPQISERTDTPTTESSEQAPSTLAFKIIGFQPLRNGYGVQITENNGQFTLRVVPLSDPEKSTPVSEIPLEETPYLGFASFANGNLIYLISNDYALGHSSLETAKSNIQVLDFTKPETPQKRGVIEVSGYYDIFQPDVIPPSDPYHRWGQILQMNDSMLVLIGYNGQELPPKNESSIKVLDLSDPDIPKLGSDLKFDTESNAYAYFIKGETLYFTRVRDIGNTEYYLERINLSDISAPVRKLPVKIPGTCIGVDSSGTYAYTAAIRPSDRLLIWSSINYNMSIVRLENDSAVLMSEATLNGLPPTHTIISDGVAYLDGGGITAADLRDPNKLTVYPGSGSFTTFTGIKNRILFTSAGLFRFTADDPLSLKIDERATNSWKSKSGGWSFDEIVRYSYGSRIVFSDTAGYMPMGQYGLRVISFEN